MKTFLKAFTADESGASAAEYALILAVVGVGIGAAAYALGDAIKDSIGFTQTSVDACGGNGSFDASCTTGAD